MSLEVGVRNSTMPKVVFLYKMTIALHLFTLLFGIIFFSLLVVKPTRGQQASPPPPPPLDRQEFGIV